MFACVIVLRARPDPFAISSRLPPVSGGGGDGGGGGGGGDASITSFGRSDFCISILTGRKCQGGGRVAAQFMGETPRGGKPGEETKGGGGQGSPGATVWESVPSAGPAGFSRQQVILRSHRPEWRRLQGAAAAQWRQSQTDWLAVESLHCLLVVGGYGQEKHCHY